MNRNGVERLPAEPSFKRMMKETAAFDVREGFDFTNQSRPFLPLHVVQRERTPAENLRQLKDLKGPGVHTGFLAAGIYWPKSAFQFSEWSAIPGVLGGDMTEGHALQDQADCQILRQGSRRYGKGHPVAPNLHLPDHAGPAAQCQQTGGDVGVPLGLGDAEQFE